MTTLPPQTAQPFDPEAQGLRLITNDPEMQGMYQGDLMAWTEAAQDQLLQAARERFKVLIQPEDLAAIALDDINPAKPPAGRQDELIRAGRWCLEHGQRFFNIMAQMGSGKTKMSANIVQRRMLLARREGKIFRVHVICPPNLIEKWVREFTEEYDAAAVWAANQGWFIVPPTLRVLVARRVSDLDPHQRKRPGHVHPLEADLLVSSYEDIALSYERRPAFLVKPRLEEDGRIAHKLCDCPRNQYKMPAGPPCCTGHRKTPHGPLTFCGQHHGPIVQDMVCPHCGARQVEEVRKVKTFLGPDDYGNAWRTCCACDEPLWQANMRALPARAWSNWPAVADIRAWAERQRGRGSRKIGLADYLARHGYKFLQPDVVIVDEVHKAKSAESARGEAAGNLLALAKQMAISLTATPTGGYASSVFPLGFRTWPMLRRDFAFKDVARFVNLHGTWERTFERGERAKADELDNNDVGAVSSRKREGAYGKPKKKEVPGLSPAAYTYFVSHAVFALLNEIFHHLPPYTEDVWTVDLDDTTKYPILVSHNGEDPEQKLWTQKEAHDFVHKALRNLMLMWLKAGSRRFLGTYFTNALRYPNIMTEDLVVHDPKTRQELLRVGAFPEHAVFPKEQRMLDAVVSAARQGLKTLIYVTHVHAPDVAGRLYSLLTTHGKEQLGRPLNVVVLRADTVKPEQREAYIKQRMVEEHGDVMICSPQLVEVGLDLVWARQILWYQQITSVYTMSQASRRSLRPGVDGQVDVNFLLYQNTAEMLIAQLMAKKLRVHALMSGSGQYDAFTRDLSGAMDLTTMLAEQLSEGAHSLFIDPQTILADLKPVIILKQDALALVEGLEL